MRLNISLFNHGYGRVTLHDYCTIFFDGLRALGHEVTISPNSLDTAALNIVFEYNPETVNTHLFATGASYVLAATEHPSVGTDGLLRLNGRVDSDWGHRSAGFVEAVKRAKAVWTLWPGSENYYRHYVSAAYLELGYSPLLAAEYAAAAAAPDIDFAFTGVLTPHRVALLDALQQRGAIVAHKPGLIPVAERNALMARSRIILCPKQHPTWPMGSSSRVAGALHAGRLAAQEPCMVVTRPCHLAAEPEPGQNYIDWLMDLRDRPTADMLDVRLGVYRDTMPTKLMMEQALDGVLAKA